jgi:hypothetical protein
MDKRLDDLLSSYGILQRKLAIAEQEIERLKQGLLHIKAMRVENLRQICMDCDDNCTHGIYYDNICRAIDKTLTPPKEEK